MQSGVSESISVCVCVYARVHVCKVERLQEFMCMRACACACVYVWVWVCVCVCVYVGKLERLKHVSDLRVT